MENVILSSHFYILYLEPEVNGFDNNVAPRKLVNLENTFV